MVQPKKILFILLRGSLVGIGLLVLLQVGAVFTISILISKLLYKFNDFMQNRSLYNLKNVIE